MRQPNSVKLKVFAPNSSVVISATSQSLQIGTNLHIVAVTARTPSSQPLLFENVVYTYDLQFSATSGVPDSAPGLRSSGIFSAAGGPALGYGGKDLPSFSLPPSDLNSLRIVHGSCRKPHARGRDALSAVDGMIATTATSASARPHYLLLTGDQIYGDDVSDALLFMLIDATHALISNLNEPFPIVQGGPTALPGPGARQDMSNRAGFTSTAAQSHLVQFGEYCAMYLFAWSDTLWTDLPSFAQVFPGEPTSVGPPNSRFNHDTAHANAFRLETTRLQNFQLTLSAVRKALANVPTYMIFDDHEVTDDWYLDREWVNATVANALGSQIIQNGVAAYGLFQGWGNVPDAFEGTGKGATLLTRLTDWIASPTAAKATPLRNSLGLPTTTQLSGDFVRSPDAVDWHVAIRGPSHQILLMDNRTRRGYPGGAHNHPELLNVTASVAQFSALQKPGPDEVIIVVAPTPVAGYPIAEAHQLSDTTAPAVYEDDVETWSGQPSARERLIATLATLPDPVGGQRRARIVLLSGDVHYGFAARIRYTATTPFGSASQNPAEAVVAQLTSSALKNLSRESGIPNRFTTTTFLHYHGYTAPGARGPFVLLGWNNPGGAIFSGGTTTATVPETVQTDLTVRGDPAVVKQPNVGYVPNPDRPANWRYQVEYIVSDDDGPRTEGVTAKHVDFPAPGDRNAELKAWNAIGAHRVGSRSASSPPKRSDEPRSFCSSRPVTRMATISPPMLPPSCSLCAGA
jgi:hypothetical protein